MLLYQVTHVRLNQVINWLAQVLVSGGLGSSHGVVSLVRHELGGTGGGPKIRGQASVVGDQASNLLGRGVVPCVAYLAVSSVMATASPLARLEILGVVSFGGRCCGLHSLFLCVVRALEGFLIWRGFMLLVLCALGLSFRRLLEPPWLHGGGSNFFFVPLWGLSRFFILESGGLYFVAFSFLCWALSALFVLAAKP